MKDDERPQKLGRQFLLTLLFLCVVLATTWPMPQKARALNMSVYCLQVTGSSACLGGGSTPSPLCTPPFSAPNNYPAACFAPYSKATSNPWNTAAAASATVDASSSTWVSFYHGAGYPFFTSMQFGYANQANQYQHPIYFGNSGDPTWTVSCSGGFGNCSGSWHAPSFITPAGGTDHHMSIVDSTQSNEELDCWMVTNVNTSTHVITANNCDQNGNITTGAGIYNEQTRSGFWLWAGVLRAQEIVAAAATGNVIPHALIIIAPCTSTTAQYPSLINGTDTECSGNAGAPYGGWMRINMSDAAIAATGAPLYAQAIMKTFAHYGGFIGDTNGGSQFSIQTEADPMYSAAGYTNANCPTNGAPCTPETAWANVNYPGLWGGSYYAINIGQYVPSGDWQFLDNPPGS